MVTVIFTNLKFGEKLEKLNKFIKTNRAFKYILCAVLTVAAVLITVIASGVTFGYTVKYSDEVIAVVSSEADFAKADAIVADSMDAKTADKASISPKFGFTLTVADNLNTTNEIVEAIVNSNDDIVEATAFILNGEVAFCSESDIERLADNRLRDYYVDGAVNTSSFVDDVKIQKGYYLKSDLVDLYGAMEVINNLDVQNVAVKTKEVEIPFETKNVKTNKKAVGYSSVTQKGVNGIAEKTEKIISVNGKTVSKEKVSQKVIKEQVTEIVTVGTGVKYVSATSKANIASAGFICPLKKGVFVVSAYYGDGRNHEAIDLAADRGTPIFAAAAGKVTFTGYDSQYGYNIIIEHSNGMKTRYAHADALCVKKGATVSQGDMIATVGSTGYSTGNHLHFEVIVNGNRVNPGPYIGLR